MATFTLQKASWCPQISRTSRTFAVSFTTALPRRGKPRHLKQESNPLPENSNPLHFRRHNTTRPSTKHADARRNFTSTNVYRAQQAAASPASNPTHLDAHPPQSPETISPDTPDLKAGLNDQNVQLDEGDGQVDWTRSFHGLSTEAFSSEAAKALLAPIHPDDIEVKPDGIIYLPEIKYRRILNQAFGPGGWGLAPRGETIVTAKAVTREYALVALGRYVQNDSINHRVYIEILIGFRPGSSQSLVANRTTFHPITFPRQSKAANPRLSDDAARILALLANCGIQDLYGSFLQSIQRKSLWSTRARRSERRCFTGRMMWSNTPTRRLGIRHEIKE